MLVDLVREIIRNRDISIWRRCAQVAFLLANAIDEGEAGSIPGPEGPPGPQGEQGPQGPQGIQGEQGEQGDTGPQGIQGTQGPTGPEGDIGPQGPPGVDGSDGSDGADGSNGSNGADGKTVRNGTSAPGAGLGVDGDFYINTASDEIYGPKASGNWGSPTSLIGPQGATGPQGDEGPQGDPLSVLTAYPVGSVYISVVSTNPGTLFGGTWAAFAAGRVLVGLDAGQTEFDTVEETGGAKTVTLTAAQSGLPQHTHTQNSFAPRIINSGTAGTVGVQGASAASNANASNAATTATNQNAGPSDAAQAHQNLQPYIVVYMWKRTA